jgi:hypothetical protein
LKVPDAVGVPLIVIVLLAHAAVTPAGKPVAAPIPVAPVVVCVIAVSAVLIHNVGVLDAAVTVLFGVIVIVGVVVNRVVHPVADVVASTLKVVAIDGTSVSCNRTSNVSIGSIVSQLIGFCCQ